MGELVAIIWDHVGASQLIWDRVGFSGNTWDHRQIDLGSPAGSIVEEAFKESI